MMPERPRGRNMSDGIEHADVVTALCNQPEAFASDLSDDQSCYLFHNCCIQLL